MGSFQYSLEDIKIAPFLQSSKHLFRSHLPFLYNSLKLIRPELSILSHIMAVVTSPTLPFNNLERHEISNALESSAELRYPVSSSKNDSWNGDRYLVVSPYDEKPHLLDLDTLDTPNRLLARALVGLKCLREDYATAPYIETFNVCSLTSWLLPCLENSGSLTKLTLVARSHRFSSRAGKSLQLYLERGILLHCCFQISSPTWNRRPLLWPWCSWQSCPRRGDWKWRISQVG